MTTSYVHLRCAGDGCVSTIRILITENILGKSVIIGCPTCKTKNRVTIPERITDGSNKVPKYTEPDWLKDFAGFGDLFGKK